MVPEVARQTKTATIAKNGSLSDAIDLSDTQLVGMIMPAAWTAADMTFQGSLDNVTFYDLYFPWEVSGSAEMIMKADASRAITLNPSDFVFLRYLKVRSGTTGTPVSQDDARELTLVCMPAAL